MSLLYVGQDMYRYRVLVIKGIIYVLLKGYYQYRKWQGYNRLLSATSHALINKSKSHSVCQTVPAQKTIFHP